MLAAVFTGSPAALVVSVLLAGLAAAWGALVRAFAAHRRGAWQLMLALTAAGVLGPALGWMTAGRLTAPGALSVTVDAVLLALLLHRDSREWVGAHEPRWRPVQQPGGRR
jgi:uncharacterized membrane protein YfcA